MNSLDEIVARLSLHELILEVFLSMQLANLPPEIASRARSDLVRVLEYNKYAGSGSVAQPAAAIQTKMDSMLSIFMDKVAARESHIRATMRGSSA